MFSTTFEPPVHGNRSSAPRDRAREAEAVRALAYTYRDTDPGFADDLYAAAERHERSNDDSCETVHPPT